jgi:putative endonuclease
LRSCGACALMNKGTLGESIAASYLEQKGWTLLYRNWRRGSHEIDLIARDGDEVVFVEVRAISPSVPWEAETTITQRKQNRLRRAIAAFYHQHPEYEEYPGRIDILAIRLTHPPQIYHLTDAFR